MARRIGTRNESTKAGLDSDTGSSGRLMVQALVKGLTVVSVFDVWRPEWTVDEIAKEVDLPKMTVYRLVRTMEDLGFLVGDPATNRYHLGPSILAAGYSLCPRLDSIVKVARPYLVKMAEETKESASLAVSVDGVAVQIDSVQGARPFRSMIAPGRITGWTSHAKLFAAYNPAGDRNLESPQYVRPPRVSKDAGELEIERAKIRKEGIAYDLEERESGTCAVAAPVFDQVGDVVASMALVAPPGRFQEPERELFGQAVKRTALSLSRFFGYMPPAGAE